MKGWYEIDHDLLGLKHLHGRIANAPGSLHGAQALGFGIKQAFSPIYNAAQDRVVHSGNLEGRHSLISNQNYPAEKPPNARKRAIIP